MSYPALSAINDQEITYYQTTGLNDPFTTDKYPTIWIGRHKNYLYDTSLHIPDTESLILTRTESNGSTANIIRRIYELDPIASNLPPDSIRYGEDDWETNVGETIDVEDNLIDRDLGDEESAYFNGNVASHDSLPQPIVTGR